MKIVHFALDDKAIRHLRRLYVPALSGDHIFIIVKNPVLGFLHKFEHAPDVCSHLELTENDRFVDVSYLLSPDLSHDLADADIVFLHAFFPDFSPRILRCLPATALVVWNAWGGEMYDLIPEFKAGSLLLPLTTHSCNRVVRNGSQYESQGLISKYWKKLCAIPRHLIKGLEATSRAEPTFWSRIDIFSGDSRDLHERLRQCLPNFRAEWLPLGYYDIESLTSMSSLGTPGDVIQVGHAAWPLDNHLEAFALLKNAGLDKRRLFLPLNYGGKEYGDMIEAAARIKFRTDPVILRGWLSLDEYTKISTSVGYLILNSISAVAFGSIIPHLYRGGRLFLRQENPHASLLRELGIVFHSTDEILADGEDLFKPFDSATQENNRLKLERFWSRMAVQRRISLLGCYVDFKRSLIRSEQRLSVLG